MRALIFLITSLLLTGCATAPINPLSASEVPSDRLYAFQSPTSDYGQVVVTRDTGHVASRCFGGFYINGVLAGKFGAGETATFYVPSGELLLKYTSDPDGK